MSRISAHLSAKWIPTILETSISIASAIVFFLLDFLDIIMCMFFRIFDEFLEGKPSSCYCMETKVIQKVEEKKENFLEVEGECELSESLSGRKNLFKEMGLFRISRTWSKREAFRVEKGNRWSECGCESCLSWMNCGCSGLRLHVVVKESPKARMELNSKETAVQNVIFIHGMLSSSLLWTEEVFPNLSQHMNQNYNFFAVDLLGFGRSPKPRDCRYTLKDHVEMIEKSVIHPFQMNSFHLVGHSLGGLIALGLAAKYSKSVKSVTLVAPPYFSSSQGNASLAALKTIAPRLVWPPVIFAVAFGSWYEHLGRCICFLICRNHRTWEWIMKRLTGQRDLHFSVIDITRHTHHSVWHTMHNVICGGAKFLDNYLQVLMAAGVKIRVIQGTKDQVVPPECSYNMKIMAPDIELETVPNADHSTVIIGREKEFLRNLENLWTSTG